MKSRLLLFIAGAAAAGCQRYQPMPLDRPAVERVLAAPGPDSLSASVDALHHPLLAPVKIDLAHGLTPESAAVLAVISNPLLRAARDQHSLSSAQLLQAQLLPNPTLDASLDPVTGGNTLGTSTAYNVGVSWDVTALITHEAKVAAARAGAQAARLDVAWQEWQVAQGAKKAVYDLIALRAQVAELRAVSQRLRGNLALIRSAVDSHNRTLLDLSAAETASQKADADLLAAERDQTQEALALNRAIGFPPGAQIRIQSAAPLPSTLNVPSEAELVEGLECRRLDLLALRRGYQSQEQTLRVAVLSQFPKIVLGFHQASDTTNVHTTGFGVTIELPIFDRQQGAIALEKATRQKLFDEYAGRLFEARSAIAQSLADIRSLTVQIAAAERGIPALQRLVKTYELAAKERNLDVLSYYAAQNDLAQRRVDLLKLKQQLLDNQVALELAAGRFFQNAVPSAKSPTTRPATTEVTP